MICPKCGQDNNEGSTFCIKCGTNLKVQELRNEAEVPEEPQVASVPEPTPEPVAVEPTPAPEAPAPAEPTPVPEAPVPASPVESAPAKPKAGFNIFAYIIAAFLKPFTSFRKEKDNLSNAKNSFILGGIIVAALTIFNYIRTAITVLKIDTDLSVLGELDYVDLFLKKLLIYACIVFGVAGVIYLVKLILKKEANYLTSLAVVATSVVPYILVAMFLSPICGLIWDRLQTIVYEIATIYTLISLYELTNQEFQLEGDKKVFANLALFGTLYIIFYIVAVAMETSFGFGIII